MALNKEKIVEDNNNKLTDKETVILSDLEKVVDQFLKREFNGKNKVTVFMGSFYFVDGYALTATSRKKVILDTLKTRYKNEGWTIEEEKFSLERNGVTFPKLIFS